MKMTESELIAKAAGEAIELARYAGLDPQLGIEQFKLELREALSPLLEKLDAQEREIAFLRAENEKLREAARKWWVIEEAIVFLEGLKP